MVPITCIIPYFDYFMSLLQWYKEVDITRNMYFLTA